MSNNKALVIILTLALSVMVFISALRADPLSVTQEVDVRGQAYLSVTIEGEIVSDSFTILNDLMRDRTYDKLPLIIHIYTPGGDANAMFSFINLAQERSAPIITINEGKAYSAGAVIYALGDIRVARAGSSTLFHSVQFQIPPDSILNVSEIEDILSFAHSYNQKVYDFLVDVTGHSEKFIRETYFIENDENNKLSFGKLSSFGLVSCRYNTFLDTFSESGLEGVQGKCGS